MILNWSRVTLRPPVRIMRGICMRGLVYTISPSRPTLAFGTEVPFLVVNFDRLSQIPWLYVFPGIFVFQFLFRYV